MFQFRYLFLRNKSNARDTEKELEKTLSWNMPKKTDEMGTTFHKLTKGERQAIMLSTLLYTYSTEPKIHRL